MTNTGDRRNRARDAIPTLWMNATGIGRRLAINWLRTFPRWPGRVRLDAPTPRAQSSSLKSAAPEAPIGRQVAQSEGATRATAPLVDKESMTVAD